MKTPLFFALVTLALLWSVGEASYRAGHDRGYNSGYQARQNIQVAELQADIPSTRPAPLEAEETAVRVVVVPGMKRYHSRYCRLVRNPQYLRFSQVLRLGYTPCPECHK